MCSIVPVDTCSDCPWEKFHSFLSQDHLESKIKLCMFHYSHAIRILHKRKTPVVWVCWASRDRGHNKTDAGGTPTPYPPRNCLKEVQCCLKCLLRAFTVILIQLLYALFFYIVRFQLAKKHNMVLISSILERDDEHGEILANTAGISIHSSW